MEYCHTTPTVRAEPVEAAPEVWIGKNGIATSSKRAGSITTYFGFTLIELLVVLAVLAVLASIVTPQYMERVQDARETALQQDLVHMRKLIDQFYADKKRYPKNLDELVQERYMRAIPEDPITGRKDTWKPIPSKEGVLDEVFDVKSGAAGKARDGRAFGEW